MLIEVQTGVSDAFGSEVKLAVPTERCDDLHQTEDQFLHCANTPRSGRGDIRTTIA